VNESLLILHGGALGDLALTLQLALRVSGVNRESAVQVISRTDPGDLSGCQPGVLRVSSDGIGTHWLFTENAGPEPGRLRELFAGRWVLNALGSVDSVVHRRLVSAGARDVYSFDPRPKPGLDAHITAQWRQELASQDLLVSGGEACGSESRTLAVPVEMRERGRKRLAAAFDDSSVGPSPDASSTSQSSKRSRAPRFVLIHPGSGGRAKCWPLAGFLDVGWRLRELGESVCFVIGPVEIERWSPAEMNAIRGEFPIIVSPTPDELLGLLAAVDVCVSNDAGPAHLAALIGMPTVTIFGPTSAVVWRPLGSDARTVVGDPRRHPEDWGIDPQRVVDALRGA
jgi:hypothetical protein